LRLHQVGYDDSGDMTYPHHDEPVPESALPGYLDEAREVFARAAAVDAAAPAATAATDRQVSADFEHLRWFELPAVCLQP
jgi:hypothetical protein